MKSQPRAYQNELDIEKMRQLLVLGRKGNNGSYYVHPGDLNWWLYYPPREELRKRTIFLWEKSDNAQVLLGWALLSPDWRAVDVFVHPDLRDTTGAQNMYDWAINQACLEMAPEGGEICTMWIFEDDLVLTGTLKSQGFQSGDYAMQYLECHLEELSSSSISLPEGFSIRAIQGEEDLEKRAAVSHAAFGSKLPIQQYVNRYLAFMQSPVYQPQRDLIVVAPDGSFAGFCILWLDAVNQMGLLEPVGIHPDYQKKGLGRALMTAGLEKLKSWGMERAMVCVENTNTPAIHLYQAVGFKPIKPLRTYKKRVIAHHSE